jgi:hypothetical protein
MCSLATMRPSRFVVQQLLNVPNIPENCLKRVSGGAVTKYPPWEPIGYA